MIIIIMFLYFVKARFEPGPNLIIRNVAKDIGKFNLIALLLADLTHPVGWFHEHIREKVFVENQVVRAAIL